MELEPMPKNQTHNCLLSLIILYDTDLWMPNSIGIFGWRPWLVIIWYSCNISSRFSFMFSTILIATSLFVEISVALDSEGNLHIKNVMQMYYISLPRFRAYLCTKPNVPWPISSWRSNLVSASSGKASRSVWHEIKWYIGNFSIKTKYCTKVCLVDNLKEIRFCYLLPWWDLAVCGSLLPDLVVPKMSSLK